MRYIISITILFLQLFALPVKAEAKDNSVSRNEIVIEFSTVATTDTDLAQEYISALSFKFSAGRHTTSLRTQIAERLGITASAVALETNNSFSAQLKNATVFTHIQVALLLLFPKHYFW